MNNKLLKFKYISNNKTEYSKKSKSIINTIFQNSILGFPRIGEKNGYIYKIIREGY